MNGGLLISIFYSAINPTQLCNYDVSHKVCDVLFKYNDAVNDQVNNVNIPGYKYLNKESLY